ncbi:MAG: HU family DNA-binding protein [Candidatus Aureabacteria bacterium]|nr:HU family DNA-binding protein [Candidatus Auribacterota bacterium]
MNKGELIEAVLNNKDAGLESKASAERVVNAVIDSIQGGLKKEGIVQVVGLGTFKVKSRAARKGRNPKTGESINIKASKTVGFKASSELKKMVG